MIDRSVARVFVGVHSAAIIGAALALAGFLMIGLGWYGTARTFFLPSQVAYLLSGGALGLATLATGLTVAGAHLHRVSTARRAARMATLTADAAVVVELLRRRVDEDAR